METIAANEDKGPRSSQDNLKSLLKRAGCAAAPRATDGVEQMKFELNQIWQSTTDATMQAKVIEVFDDGNRAKLRMLTHGVGTFELNRALLMSGIQKWQLAPYR